VQLRAGGFSAGLLKADAGEARSVASLQTAAVERVVFSATLLKSSTLQPYFFSTVAEKWEVAGAERSRRPWSF
jgi:hypothetical protein